MSGTAWAIFDSADMREGGQIKGTAYLSSDPDQKPEWSYKLAGPFTATLCK